MDRCRIAAVPPPRGRQLLRRRALVVLLWMCVDGGDVSVHPCWAVQAADWPQGWRDSVTYPQLLDSQDAALPR